MRMPLEVRNSIGWIMQRIGVPGLVQPFHHNDYPRGIKVSLRTSRRYAILTVNGCELFFDRESGKFDGVGCSADSGGDVEPRCTED